VTSEKIRREKWEKAVGNGYWKTMFPEFNSPYPRPHSMESRIKGIEFHWNLQIGELKCFLSSVHKRTGLRRYVHFTVWQSTILRIEINATAIVLLTDLSTGPLSNPKKRVHKTLTDNNKSAGLLVTVTDEISEQTSQ
jgi:hypothetical protein